MRNVPRRGRVILFPWELLTFAVRCLERAQLTGGVWMWAEPTARTTDARRSVRAE